MRLTGSCANLEGSITRTPNDLRDNIIASPEKLFRTRAGFWFRWEFCCPAFLARVCAWDFADHVLTDHDLALSSCHRSQPRRHRGQSNRLRFQPWAKPDNVEKLRQRIAADGELICGPDGALCDHPALKPEITARGFVVRGLQQLGLLPRVR
jgi:hypothetical protein